jgi:hypothetical protein
LNLEEGVGVNGAHDEVIKAIEKYLDSIEIRSTRRKRRTPQRRR